MRQAGIPPAVFTLSVLVALLLASPPAALRAQEFRALITGQVMDPSGAAIPGAAIKAIKIDTKLCCPAGTLYPWKRGASRRPFTPT